MNNDNINFVQNLMIIKVFNKNFTLIQNYQMYCKIFVYKKSYTTLNYLNYGKQCKSGLMFIKNIYQTKS